jgi:hypothetical protein
MLRTTTRRLTVYSDIRYGIFYRFKLIPYIRLKGLWLKSAGFEPGSKIEVTVRSQELIIKTSE